MNRFSTLIDRFDSIVTPSHPARFPRLRALGVATGVAVGAAATVSVATLPILSAVGSETPNTPNVLLGSVIAGQAAFALVGLLYVRRYLPDTTVRIPTQRERRLILAGTVATTVTAFGLEALGSAVGVDPLVSVYESVAVAQPGLLLALAALALLIVGPAEELLFRGAIQARLGRSFGAVSAVALTSLLFTVLHFGNYDAGRATVGLAMTIIFVVSSILGMLYTRTDNLAVPILVHGLYDAIVFLVLYGAAAGWL